MTAKKITRRTFLGTTAVGAASTSLSLNTWAQAINNQKSPLINGSIPALEGINLRSLGDIAADLSV